MSSFKFPSVLLVCSIGLLLPFGKAYNTMYEDKPFIFLYIGNLVTASLISLFGGRLLLCSKEGYIDTLKQPSPYCIVTGIK